MVVAPSTRSNRPANRAKTSTTILIGADLWGNAWEVVGDDSQSVVGWEGGVGVRRGVAFDAPNSNTLQNNNRGLSPS